MRKNVPKTALLSAFRLERFVHDYVVPAFSFGDPRAMIWCMESQTRVSDFLQFCKLSICRVGRWPYRIWLSIGGLHYLITAYKIYLNNHVYVAPII